MKKIGLALLVFFSIYFQGLSQDYVPSTLSITKLTSPTFVATNSAGNIVVVDSNYLIKEFTPAGILVKKFGGKGAAIGTFLSISGLAITKGDSVYVADNVNNTFSKASANGVFKPMQYSLSGVQGLATDGSGNLYAVCSTFTNFYKYNPSSVLIQTSLLGYSNNSSITVDKNGNVFIVNITNKTINKYTPAGSLIKSASIAGITGLTTNNLATDANGRIYLSDFLNNHVQIYTNDLTLIKTITTTSPRGIAVANNGTIYVANSGSNKIDVFTPTPIAISSSSSTNPTCAGGNNGSIVFSTNLGSSSDIVTYKVTNSSGNVNYYNATSPGFTINNLSAGTYTIMVKDSNNATSATKSIILTEPSAKFNFSKANYCSNEANPAPTLFSGAIGGVFSANGGLSINASTGLINLSTASNGNYNISNTLSVAGCTPLVYQVTVKISKYKDPTIRMPKSNFCLGEGDANVNLGTNAVKGYYTYPANLLGDTATGSVYFSVANAKTGSYVVTNTISTDGICPTVSDTAAFAIRALPNAVITGKSNICSGFSDTLKVQLLGTAPFNFTIKEGTINSIQNGINNTPFSWKVTPSITTDYVINTISDKYCSTNAATGFHKLNVNTPPTASFVTGSSQTICEGSNLPISIAFTGKAPFTFTVRAALKDSVISGVKANPLVFNVSPKINLNYTLRSVSDSLCAGTISASNTVNISIINSKNGKFSYPKSTYVLGETNTISPVLMGTAEAGTFVASSANIIVDSKTGEIDLNASKIGNYTVTNVVQNTPCPSTSDTAYITIQGSSAKFSFSNPFICKSSTQKVKLQLASNAILGKIKVLTTGLEIDTITGEIDPSKSLLGTYTVVNTIKIGTLTNADSVKVTVFDNSSTADFQYAGTPYCLGSANPNPTLINNATKGIFSCANSSLVIDSTTGVVNLKNSSPGIYEITNTLKASGCNTISAKTILTILNLVKLKTPKITLNNAGFATVNEPITKITADSADYVKTYNWMISPSNAGTIASTSGRAFLVWNGNYSGSVEIKLTTTTSNASCSSDTTPVSSIQRAGMYTVSTNKTTLFYNDTANIEINFQGTKPFKVRYQYGNFGNTLLINSNSYIFKTTLPGTLNLIVLDSLDNAVFPNITKGSQVITITQDTVKNVILNTQQTACKDVNSNIYTTILGGKKPYQIVAKNVNTNELFTFSSLKIRDTISLDAGKYVATITDSAGFSVNYKDTIDFFKETIDFSNLKTYIDSVPFKQIYNGYNVSQKAFAYLSEAISKTAYSWKVYPSTAIENIVNTDGIIEMKWKSNFSGDVKVVAQGVKGICKAIPSDTLRLKILPNVVVKTLLQNDRTKSELDSIQFDLYGRTPYSVYFKRDGIADSAIIVNTQTIKLPANYTKIFTMENVEDSLIVAPLSEVIDTRVDSIMFYDAFSPQNGDILNEYFWVENFNLKRNSSLKVFDLNGFLVFESNNQRPYNNDWNGVNNQGEPLSHGLYYFVFEIKDNGTFPANKKQTGYIQIKR